MNLFDQLVESALATRPELSNLRPAVEKELLHHDILREMSRAGFLDRLTFIGGTCLRDCYGSARLSEDLDFTGGQDFDRRSLSNLGAALIVSIKRKYGLEVSVSEPTRESSNVDTWKLKVITRPAQSHLPAQKVNIDICAARSHIRTPVMIRNQYGSDFGTAGLVLMAQSKEEILADKAVAIGLRPNRVKYRDIWDIVWLSSQGIKLDDGLVSAKLIDRNVDERGFWGLIDERLEGLAGAFGEYLFEMRRFLPLPQLQDIERQPGYWDAAVSLVRDVVRPPRKA